MLHKGDYSLRQDGDEFTFVNAQVNVLNGNLYPQFRGMHNPDRIIDKIRLAHSKQGIHIDKRTAVTRWCGESIDYGLTIASLFERDKVC